MPKSLTLVQLLEARMRPGILSQRGFLGPTESLERVISEDAQTLARFGISYERIADRLEALLQPMRGILGFGPYPTLHKPETIPHFSLDNLPDIKLGRVTGNLHVFVQRYRGFQVCPWECKRAECSDDAGFDKFFLWGGSFDFLILNRETAEFVTGPGLVVHLIREHHFFEGMESPYRTDPSRLISVLGLA
jgi:hypothetical protein